MVYDKAHNLALINDYKRTGSRRDLGKVVAYNEGLVLKKARDWSNTNPALEFDDAYQCGMMGLVKAIDRFDPERTYTTKKGEVRHIQFSSFAGPYIWGEISHYQRDKGHTLKLPRAWYNVRRKLLDGRAAGLSDAELAALTGLPEDDISTALHAVRFTPLTSLDQPCTDEGSTLAELLPSRADSGRVLYSVEDLLDMAGATTINDDYFDLTEICQRYGKVPGNYLALAGTKQKADALQNIANNNIFRVKRGRNGRVWAHKAIAPHFLRWVNAEQFGPVIDRALLSNLESKLG